MPSEAPSLAELPKRQVHPLIYALYAIQQLRSVDQVYDALASKDNPAAPAISLIVARHPLPWNSETTRRIAGQCQTPNAGISQRDFALQNLVAAGTLLPHIEWPKGLALDWRQNGHRALQTALAERILLFRKQSEAPPDTKRAVVNKKHLWAQ